MELMPRERGGAYRRRFFFLGERSLSRAPFTLTPIKQICIRFSILCSWVTVHDLRQRSRCGELMRRADARGASARGGTRVRGIRGVRRHDRHLEA